MPQTAEMRTRVISALTLLGTAALVAVAQQPSSATTTHRRTSEAKGIEWPTYHGTGHRFGRNAYMPTYRGGLHVMRRLTLDGAVYASPIVARKLTIVATENDTVYAFDGRYRQVWKRHLGTPAAQSELPCGNVFPLGITGTPAYSAKTGLVYVAAEFGAPVRHRLFALRVGSGRVASKRTLDFRGVETRAMQERGALAIAGGRIWTPFGGLDGDCGGYKGRVVGWPLTGSGAAVRYTVPTAREAGIWAAPGPTVDYRGNLLVAVGNGASGPGGRYDHSDSVLHLRSSNAHLFSSFSPSSWAADNQSDLDLGSQGPAIVGGKWVFAAGKSGAAYTLRLAHLGGIGGSVSRRNLCTSFGGTAVAGSVVYVPCTDGVRAVRIGSSGRMRVLWHAGSSITGSPVIGGGQVWALDPGAGVLHALGTGGGRDHAAVSVGSVSRFATPALSGRRILIGTLSGLTVLRY
jgi:hypothetical protein